MKRRITRISTIGIDGWRTADGRFEVEKFEGGWNLRDTWTEETFGFDTLAEAREWIDGATYPAGVEEMGWRRPIGTPWSWRTKVEVEIRSARPDGMRTVRGIARIDRVGGMFCPWVQDLKGWDILRLPPEETVRDAMSAIAAAHHEWVR